MSAPSRPPVVIVDDEIGIRGLLEDVLRDLGYETIAAADGAGAVEGLRRRPDAALAIIDLNLADRGGLEVVGDLRALAPGLPAIISTGFQESLARGALAKKLEEVRASGPVELLAKPYRIDQLASLVERLARRA